MLQSNRLEGPIGDRVSAASIRARKNGRFPAITAYDAPFARFAESAGIDVLLVGDSVGSFVLGLDPEQEPDLTDMCRHTAAVSRATHHAHVIADVPGRYLSDDITVLHAARSLVAWGANSVKVEGGHKIASRVRTLTGSGIPVVGHIGADVSTASEKDSSALEVAGAFAIVLAGIDPEVASSITRNRSIPTIGIGSGADCDAQIALIHTVLGIDPRRRPRMDPFLDLQRLATSALEEYAVAVRRGDFPRR